MSDSNDAILECPFGRARNEKLGIFCLFHLTFVGFLQSILIHFCVCALSTLIPDWSLFLYSVSVSRTSRHLQWSVFHLQLSFSSLLFYNTSMHLGNYIMVLKFCSYAISPQSLRFQSHFLFDNSFSNINVITNYMVLPFQFSA